MTIQKVKLISILMCSAALIIGLILLIAGIRDLSLENKNTKNWETTEGTLVDYELYRDAYYDAAKRTEHAATYTLIYKYEVDEQGYILRSQMATSAVPSVGTTRDIRYNPGYPEESVLSGDATGSAMILIGIMFIVIPGLIGLGFAGVLQNLKMNITDFIFGAVLIGLTTGSVYLIAGSLKPAKVFEFFSDSFNPMLLIPVLLFAAGIFLLFRSFAAPLKEKLKSKGNNKPEH